MRRKRNWSWLCCACSTPQAAKKRSTKKAVDQPLFCRRTAFYSQLDDTLITSRTHTHLSHSQTSRLPFTSLSLVPPSPPLHLGCVRLHPPPVLALCPSPHRHPHNIFPPSPRFLHYNKQQSILRRAHQLAPQNRGSDLGLSCPRVEMLS